MYNTGGLHLCKPVILVRYRGKFFVNFNNIETIENILTSVQICYY